MLNKRKLGIFVQGLEGLGIPTVCCASKAEVMDAEKTIAEIETLERVFALSDPRPLQPADIDALNQQHDTRLARNPWFQLWNTYWR